METRTISEDQWIEFFQQFSRDHAGWPATIEVLDRDSGPQHLAESLPFQGISFDTKGTRPCSVQISAGDRPERHVNHVVDMPLYIREANEPDGSVDIQFDPATGPTTLVHLRAPVD
jgi:Family of unknown function (DUF5335)